MERYTSEKPEFSETIQIVEAGDPVNAENNNASIKQLLQNTLALKKEVIVAKKESHEITDDSTGEKIRIGIEGGLVYLEPAGKEE